MSMGFYIINCFIYVCLVYGKNNLLYELKSLRKNINFLTMLQATRDVYLWF